MQPSFLVLLLLLLLLGHHDLHLPRVDEPPAPGVHLGDGERGGGALPPHDGRRLAAVVDQDGRGAGQRLLLLLLQLLAVDCGCH